MQQYARSRGPERDDDGPRYAFGIAEAQNHYRQGNQGQNGGLPGEGMPCESERPPPVEKIAWHASHPQAKEITDLRAGDENGDAVREADNDRSRKIFHAVAHAGDS